MTAGDRGVRGQTEDRPYLAADTRRALAAKGSIRRLHFRFFKVLSEAMARLLPSLLAAAAVLAFLGSCFVPAPVVEVDAARNLRSAALSTGVAALASASSHWYITTPLFSQICSPLYHPVLPRLSLSLSLSLTCTLLQIAWSNQGALLRCAAGLRRGRRLLRGLQPQGPPCHARSSCRSFLITAMATVHSMCSDSWVAPAAKAMCHSLCFVMPFAAMATAVVASAATAFATR